MAWHQYHALHSVCQLRGHLTMPPCDPRVPPTPSTTVPVHKATPTSKRPNPTDAILRKQVGYTGPRERAPRQNARASEEASHFRAARTWDRPQSYHTRAWAAKYLNRCLRPTTTDSEESQMSWRCGIWPGPGSCTNILLFTPRSWMPTGTASKMELALTNPCWQSSCKCCFCSHGSYSTAGASSRADTPLSRMYTSSHHLIAIACLLVFGLTCLNYWFFGVC